MNPYAFVNARKYIETACSYWGLLRICMSIIIPAPTLWCDLYFLTAYSKGLMPGICYTRLNFFVKGGEVTTSTIMGDIFPPCDVKFFLIELNNQLPNFLQTPTHLVLACVPYTMSLWTLPIVNLTYWPTEPVLSFDRWSLCTGQMNLP